VIADRAVIAAIVAVAAATVVHAVTAVSAVAGAATGIADRVEKAVAIAVIAVIVDPAASEAKAVTRDRLLNSRRLSSLETTKTNERSLGESALRASVS